MPRIGRVSLRIWMMCTYVRESGESFIRCKGSEQSATSSLPGTGGGSIGIAVDAEYESPSLRRHLMRRLLDISTWLMAPITLLCRFQDEYYVVVMSSPGTPTLGMDYRSAKYNGAQRSAT